jgi:hypothetical protein
MNFVGCVLFAVSAVCGFVLPATGVEVNVNVTNGATSLGALCFLVGSLLLLPEGVRQPATEQDVSRSQP